MAAAAIGTYLLLGSVYSPPSKTLSEGPLKVVKRNVSSIFLDHQLPRYTETLTGKDQEPLSFVIAASDDEALIDVFKQAGWTLASSESLGDLVRAGKAALADKPDPAAPMTPSFWNGNPHDFGFEKPLKKATVRERHHARFWKTGFKTPDGLLLYAGTASLDVGIKWGIAHRIQANIDAEREFLFSDLAGTGRIKNYGKTDFVEPLFGHNFIGDPFFTDGKIYLVTLAKKIRQ
jgi:undecaprenyl-diphosphatase